MSRHNKHWKRREESGWGNGNFKPPHPPGLRGRDIGLYYKNLQATKQNKPEYAVSSAWSFVSYNNTRFHLLNHLIQS